VHVAHYGRPTVTEPNQIPVPTGRPDDEYRYVPALHVTITSIPTGETEERDPEVASYARHAAHEQEHRAWLRASDRAPHLCGSHVADHMERRLAEETAWKKPEEKEADKGEVKHTGPRGTTTSVYIALRNAVEACPRVQRLVHLADTQRSAKWMLEQQSVGAFAQQFQLPQATDVEHKGTDLEELQLVADLRKRSLFTSDSRLYDEDRI
jgi:hypothetical protein